jgi:DNA-binding MarR family transcriptional regulator
MGLVASSREEVPVSSAQNPKSAEGACERAIKDIEQFKQHVAALERVDAELRAKFDQEDELSLQTDGEPRAQPDQESEWSLQTLRILVHMYITENVGQRNVGVMARKFKMGRATLQSHLDRLHQHGLAESGQASHRLGHMYWGVTPEGRKFIAERKLA